MNGQELFEKQYGEKKLVTENSFPFLRQFFKKYDLSREDLVYNLLSKGETLLDIGCGDGDFLFRAERKFSKLHGIDISKSRINKAKDTVLKKYGITKNFHFQQSDIDKTIKLPTETFDAIVSIAVFQYVYNPFHLIKEINRLLKPGGELVIQVPNIAYIKQRLRLLLGILPTTSSRHNWSEIGWDSGVLHSFTKKTFCVMMESSGFKIHKVTGSGLFSNIRNFYPSLLNGDLCILSKKVK